MSSGGVRQLRELRAMLRDEDSNEEYASGRTSASGGEEGQHSNRDGSSGEQPKLRRAGSGTRPKRKPAPPAGFMSSQVREMKEAVEQYKGGSSAILQKLGNFKKKAKEHKVRSEKGLQKYDWIREAQRLRLEQQETDNELQTAMERLESLFDAGDVMEPDESDGEDSEGESVLEELVAPGLTVGDVRQREEGVSENAGKAEKREEKKKKLLSIRKYLGTISSEYHRASLDRHSEALLEVGNISDLRYRIKNMKEIGSGEREVGVEELAGFFESAAVVGKELENIVEEERDAIDFFEAEVRRVTKEVRAHMRVVASSSSLSSTTAPSTHAPALSGHGRVGRGGGGGGGGGSSHQLSARTTSTEAGDGEDVIKETLEYLGLTSILSSSNNGEGEEEEEKEEEEERGEGRGKVGGEGSTPIGVTSDVAGLSQREVKKRRRENKLIARLREAEQQFESDIAHIDHAYAKKVDTAVSEHERKMHTLAEIVGEWTEDEISAFTKVLKECANQKKTRDATLKRLGIQFQNKKKSEREAMERKMTAEKHYHRSVKAMREKWEKEKDDRIQAFVKEVKAIKEEEQTRVQRAIEKCTFEVHRLKVGKDHTEKAVAFEVKKRQQDEEARRKQVEEEREQEEKARKQREEMEEKKRLLYSYRQKLDEEARKAAEEERQREEEDEERRKEYARYNEERVGYRRRQYEQKEEEKKELMRMREEEEEERQQRLEALRAQVAIDVEADPDRVLQPTEASKAQKKKQAQLFAVHGYDMNDMMKDTRLKVAMALESAGLMQTDYAREVLMKVQPPVQPRVDTLTTDQRAHLV